MIVNFWVSTTPGANSPRPFEQAGSVQEFIL
jgi:hypothetical protein